MPSPTRSSTCDLCGLPVLGRPVRSDLAGARGFCCEGCARVWAVASRSGLDTLTAGPVGDRTRDAGARKAAAAARAGARRTTLRIDGMWCSSCALVLEEALLALPGVLDAEVSYAASLARVTYEPASVDGDAIAARITLLGYRAEPGGLGSAGHGGEDETRDLFLRFFVSMAVGMWVMTPTFFLLWPSFWRGEYAGLMPTELFTGALTLVVLLYSGWPFLRGAWQAARLGKATMDTLVVVGTWTAFAYSLVATLRGGDGTYFESAAMITTIVLLGRWIESFGRGNAADALAGLAAGAPDEVWLVPEGGGLADAVRSPIGAVIPGSVLAVRAGERVPVDGLVLAGHTTLDQSRLTGEPLPVERGEGDELFAGTVNLAEAVLVRTVRTGGETLSGRIAVVVEDAAFAKSHAQRLADAVAGVFVPVIFVIALAAFAITAFAGPGPAEAVRRAVAVLVVACPCALGLATPLAAMNAIRRGADIGLLLRGGEVLERAGEIVTIAFDKTGTLSEGRPALAGFLPASLSREEAAHLLTVAAAVEAGSPHPAASAIAAAVTGTTVATASEVRSRPGLGVEGRVDGRTVLVGSARLLMLEGISVGPEAVAMAEAEGTRGRGVVWVAEGGRLLGGVVLADPLRAEAASAVATLRRRGLRTAIISGDASAPSRAVAEALGIDEVRSEVLPHDKERVVRELAAAGPLAFVGDGINDAPALAAADLAIAVGGASDVALRAADVILTRETDELSALPELLRLARRSRRIIRQNLAWAFTYNLVAVPLAVSGLLSPIAAAAAMALSSLAVVGNSWRVRWGG
ncbi:MAG: heavy metal translocating P-type ATPase [Coriobacteriia bacterium]|nr:heavy metal translocating P-type ATPase [Coriobacteriia bacterium]